METNVRDYAEVAIKFLDKAFPACLEARNDRNSIKLNQVLDNIVGETKGEVPILK